MTPETFATLMVISQRGLTRLNLNRLLNIVWLRGCQEGSDKTSLSDFSPWQFSSQNNTIWGPAGWNPAISHSEHMLFRPRERLPWRISHLLFSSSCQTLRGGLLSPMWAGVWLSFLLALYSLFFPFNYYLSLRQLWTRIQISYHPCAI